MHVDEPVMFLRPAEAARLQAQRPWLAAVALALVLLSVAIVIAAVAVAGELAQARESVDRLTDKVEQVSRQLNNWGGVQP